MSVALCYRKTTNHPQVFGIFLTSPVTIFTLGTEGLANFPLVLTFPPNVLGIAPPRQ